MSKKEITTPNLQEVIDNSESKEEEVDTTPTEEEEVSVTTDEYDKVWESDDITLEDVANQEPTQQEPIMEQEEEQVGSEESDSNINGVIITKPLKYKGNEIYVKDEDEAIALMQKGLDYEFKMSRIKPFRKAIKLIDDNGLSEEDIKALVDIKNGNKGALDYLAGKYNLKVSEPSEEDDLFTESNDSTGSEKYEPKVETEPDNDIVEYFQEYSRNNPTQAGQVLDVYNSLEPAFQLEVTQNTQLFQGFINDVVNGTFQKLYPEVLKVKAVNPNVSWLQAYVGVAQNVLKPTNKSEPTQSVEKKSTIKKRSAVKGGSDDYEAAWNDDEGFKEFERELFKGIYNG